MVQRLHTQHPVEVKYKNMTEVEKKKVPPYELLAMAYIVILLKLLFGLDDHTDR